VLTIDHLPDDVLLEIFDFYVVRYQDLKFIEEMFGIQDKIESWQTLVHVCRRWRCLVFGSPRRLNLQLCCYAPRRSARKSLDVWRLPSLWPALPLVILGSVYKDSVDDAIALLEHSDRINQIYLNCHTTLQVEKIWTAMQVPFPELVVLSMSSWHFLDGSVLPDSLLGRSAPRLRYFYLHGIPFPGLPKLLLSATHLVELYLCDIPHSGYISPEAMATCLSVLTSLETLQLEFVSPYDPDLKSRPQFPPTRSVLPTLTNFSFKGLNKYLEEFVARIEAPALHRFSTTFLNNTGFKGPELKQFVSRTPTLGAHDEAHLILS
jgi:hypothetical protein